MKTKKEVSKATRSTVKSVSSKKVVAKAATRTKAVSVKKVAAKSKPSAVVKKVSRTAPVKKHKTISASKKVVEAKKVGKRRFPSFKRSIYMGFSIILGLLIGTFVQLFIELVYMRKMMSTVANPQVYYFMGMPSYLPSLVQGFFLTAGLIFGIWLGFWGWRLVYVEKRHRSTRQS